MYNNQDLFNLVSWMSYYVAVRNLEENEQQSSLLKSRLDNQDELYLKKAIELLEKSIEQNNIIIEQNNKLLER